MREGFISKFSYIFFIVDARAKKKLLNSWCDQFLLRADSHSKSCPYGFLWVASIYFFFVFCRLIYLRFFSCAVALRLLELVVLFALCFGVSVSVCICMLDIFVMFNTNFLISQQNISHFLLYLFLSLIVIHLYIYIIFLCVFFFCFYLLHLFSAYNFVFAFASVCQFLGLLVGKRLSPCFIYSSSRLLALIIADDSLAYAAIRKSFLTASARFFPRARSTNGNDEEKITEFNIVTMNVWCIQWFLIHWTAVNTCMLPSSLASHILRSFGYLITMYSSNNNLEHDEWKKTHLFNKFNVFTHEHRFSFLYRRVSRARPCIVSRKS